MNSVDSIACPPIEDLRALLDENLSKRSYQSISSHVETCSFCQDRLETLTDDPWMTDAAKSDAFATLVPAPVAKRIIDSIATRESIGPTGWPTVSQSGSSSTKLEAGDGLSNQESLKFPDAPAIENALGAIGRYQVLRRIAAGTSGILFEAWDSDLERTVALKVLRDFAALGSESHQRLVREAKAATKLRHKNILPVYDLVERDDFPPLLVMELLSGKTLANLTKGGQTVSAKTAAELVYQAAQGLAAAHSAGLIHRDIKPSNLLVDQRDSGSIVMVADFGLVRDQADDSDLTKTGDLAGTPAYMSPEQVEDAKLVDARSDVYSLGCVLYQLLTGQPPYSGTVRMVLWQIMQEEPKTPRELDDRIPAEIQNICMKAIAKSPGSRYQSASQFAVDLENFLTGRPTIAKPISRFRWLIHLAKRHPIAAVTFIAVFLSAIAIATIATYASIRLADARNSVRMEAAKAAVDRDVALDVMEAMVFDVYDQLNQDEIDTDEIQVNVLERAAAGLSRIEAGDSESLLRHQAETHSRLGRAMWRLDRLDAADTQLRLALARIEQMPERQSNTKEIKLLGLETISVLAQVCYENERNDERTLLTVSSKDLAEQMLREFPDDRSVVSQAADSFHEFGYLTAEQVGDDEAIPVFQRAIAILARLGDYSSYDSQQKSTLLQLMMDIADSHYNMESFPEALSAYRSARERSRQVFDLEDPDNFLYTDLWNDYLIEAISGEAACLATTDRQNQSLEVSRQGWQIIDEALNERSADWALLDLADSLVDDATTVASERGDRTAAVKWAQRAVRIAKLLVGLDEADAELQTKQRRYELRLQKLQNQQ